MSFLHHFQYAMKTMIRNKTSLVWTLLFPIMLGTFMYMAFGSLGEEELFDTIPIGIVKKVENEPLEVMLHQLSEEENLLQITYMTEEEAMAKLKDKTIEGILYVKEQLQLVVVENSYESTILKSIFDEYKKQELLFKDIMETHPEAMEQVVEQLMTEQTFFVEQTTSNGNQSVYTNYFYAIFAMSCLFASFCAIEKIEKLQANSSTLGMRRSMASNSKAMMIMAEFLSMLLVQFLIEVLSLFYFAWIGIDFGEKYVAIIGILLLGCCIGIAQGIIIGSISKLSENTKSVICIAISMIFSVLADLVGPNVKYYIEHTMPIVNRINPAALIVDSFYALNIYDTYDRYMKNMVTLGGLTILLLVISFLMLRGRRYASV